MYSCMYHITFVYLENTELWLKLFKSFLAYMIYSYAAKNFWATEESASLVLAKKVNENNLNCICFLLGKILYKLTNRSWPWFKQQSKTIMPGESCLSPPIEVAYSSEMFSPLSVPPHIHLHFEGVDKKLNYTWDKELMYCNDPLTIGNASGWFLLYQ